MVIVYDMRSGDVVEQSAPSIRETLHPEPVRRDPPRVTVALQLVSHTVQPVKTPPPGVVLMGCYFDENGD